MNPSQETSRTLSILEVLPMVDAVVAQMSRHLPRHVSAEDLASAGKLALMRPDAILVNAARGGLIDEVALKTMLETGRLAGVALDVLAVEPPEDRALLSLRNVLVTPHLGGSSEEAVLAMGRAAITGLTTARLPDANWPR